MYELKIKDRAGIWHSADLLTDEAPNMNYQVNNLAELKDRQASYSQALKLPKTSKNVSIIERADIFEVNTNLPYTALECRLFSNGYALAGKGSIIIIDNITDYIETQILAGNADFFDLLGDTDLSTIDLGNTIVDSSTYPAHVRRANCVVGYYNELPQNRYAYFLNLISTINQMLSTLGYTMQHNLPSTTSANDYFSMSTRKPKDDSLDFAKAYGKQLYDDWVLPPAGETGFEIRYMPMRVSFGNSTLMTYVDNGYASDRRLRYRSNINGTIHFTSFFSAVGILVKTSGSTVIGNAGNLIVNISKNNSVLYSYAPDDEGVGIYNYLMNYDEWVDVSVNDFIDITVTIKNQGSGCEVQGTTFEFNAVGFTTDEVPAGGKLYFGNNTGFDTCLDLFKTFIQTYGLTVDVDNVNKVAKAYTMQKLYDNKTIAVDWSKKLHMGDRDVSFILDGYARANNIKFATKDNLEDKGTFNVANFNLDKTKDLFTLKWESGEDVLVNGLSLAAIPLYNYKSATDTDREIQDGKPHLVRVSRFGNPIFIANHIKAQTLIDTYYTDLTTKMLVNAKRLEALFNLTEIDIEAFDPFTPIYISYYGAYFYVEKINNFQSGNLTKVNLIKL